MTGAGIERPERPPGRCRGDRGAGLVTGLVLMFAFTAGGVVWLARDVDRSISNRSLAQSVAFQAARVGAQQVDVVAVRLGASGRTLDRDAARDVARSTAVDALARSGVRGEVVSIDVEHDRVTVRVAIHDAGRTVTGTGTVRSMEGP